MTHRLLTLSGILAALVVFTAWRSTDRHAYFSNYENVLGTSFQLKVIAENESIASAAEETALTEIDRLSSILSSYDPQSEFSRWQKTFNQDIPVSKELFEVLSLFDQWRLKTGGALNASAGIAIAAWQQAAQQQILPDPAELALAAAHMNQSHWLLDPERQTARRITRYPLVINTFAKSYIIDKATRRVTQLKGVTNATLDIGGDLVVRGAGEDHITIVNPKATADNDRPLSFIKVKNKTVATSGNYRRGYRIQNDWYSHIIDARTAIPAREIISATVVSDNPTDAGALATAFNLLTPEESAALAGAFPGVDYLIITKSGRQFMSEHWNMLEETGPTSESFQSSIGQ
ncbi:MAG TPA: FAD:protein FMN transferase, partial [Cyclobacteriaceae bacterium]|nr:FAD:protein FMN transferase [Cyclobacteriaceae bacterium]